ncbi:MAG: aminopeptidase P N-terminal domain-containing protein, partial [Cyanobacteria bacterium P01_H01_bin.130]
MPPVKLSSGLAATLHRRRQQLAARIKFPVVLWSGQPSPRNFPANTYRFRANSHFLYFAGLPLVNAAIRLDGDRLTLFMDEASVEDALWHGPTPSRASLAAAMGADAAYSMAELSQFTAGVATIAA